MGVRIDEGDRGDDDVDVDDGEDVVDVVGGVDELIIGFYEFYVVRIAFYDGF